LIAIAVMRVGRVVIESSIGWHATQTSGPVYSPRPGVTTGVRAAIFAADAEDAMAAIDEDDRPKKKIAHEIGQDLALLSIEELSERIALLRNEIVRLEEAMAKKRASKSAADQFFKR
jgi:uncharacterized small protein (DUF1192 family)